jgi:putative phosphotransacetylase
MSNQPLIRSYPQDCNSCDLPEDSKGEINEQLVDVIVDEVMQTLGITTQSITKKSLKYPPIPLGVSNRHIHLSKATFEKLFGVGAEFKVLRELYQPGEFASEHSVTIVGSKMRAISGVRILGPLRDYDQVELALTDAIQLGINAPVRRSKDLKGAAPLTLVGPQGSIYLPECAIIPNRHIHMTSEDARIYGVRDGDYCKVRIAGVKSTIFENVLIRVNDAWKLQIHLDTDDANAANVRSATEVEFIGKM